MKAPQIILLLVLLIELLSAAYAHGKEMRDDVFFKSKSGNVNKYNFWESFFKVLILVLILKWGGFFG